MKVKLGLCLAVLFFCMVAMGNIRQPYSVDYQNSGALTGGENLTVLSENLSFQCDPPFDGHFQKVKERKKFAQVKAEYSVESVKEGTYQFAFILPDPAGLTVLVNGEPIPVEAPKTVFFGTSGTIMDKHYDDLWSAGFTATLIKGQNTLLVAYNQPMSAAEISYGYSGPSRWMTWFGYKLWPLKEWQLSPDFFLTIQVSIPEAAPALFKSGFIVELYRTMPLKEKPEKLSAKLEYQKRNAHLEMRTGADFPDNVYIIIKKNK